MASRRVGLISRNLETAQVVTHWTASFALPRTMHYDVAEADLDTLALLLALLDELDGQHRIHKL